MISRRMILAATCAVAMVCSAAAEELKLGLWRYQFGPMARVIEIVQVGEEWIQRSWIDGDSDKLERKMKVGKPSPGHTMLFDVIEGEARDACELRDDKDLDLYDKDGFYCTARAFSGSAKPKAA